MKLGMHGENFLLRNKAHSIQTHEGELSWSMGENPFGLPFLKQQELVRQGCTIRLFSQMLLV